MGSGSEDDFDKDAKTTDWWGYTWSRPYKFNRVVYTTGDIVTAGGWYAEKLRVQVHQHFQWKDVNEVTTAPAYPFSRQAGSHVYIHVRSSDNTWGNGVRIIERLAADLTSHPSASSQSITASDEALAVRITLPYRFNSLFASVNFSIANSISLRV